MRTRLKAKLAACSSWKLALFSIAGAVLITDSVTSIISWLVWQEISTRLILLGTLNATIVPAILAPVLIRLVRRTTNLEALNRQLRQEMSERHRVERERKELIRQLEAKNAELERLTYTVSHDLKAPLITIRGFLGYLEKDALAGNQERVRADIARIVEAADKMQHLLRELLELLRIGQLTETPQEVLFGEVVQEALNNVEGRLMANNVGVWVEPDLPPVYGDRTRLVEVVQNLVDNAAKFIGNQPNPQIEIGKRGEEKGSPVFFVRDNGIGILPKHQERIFDLFHKLDSQNEGTGIGLAIVKRIVEVHGGRIWVESYGQGMGSTFCFTLSMAKID
jgi:signal transduction histidine kinase